MSRQLLLLLGLIIIVCLVVGTYEDVPQIVRQLRAGQIDGAEALGRIIGAMVKLADDLLAGWRPIERKIGKWIHQVDELVEHWVRKAITLVSRNRG